MAYPNAIYSAFSALGFLLCVIPLPWHLEAWNMGTCLYMIWTGFTCLSFCINSIIWRGNVIDVAPVWCDITSHLMIGIAWAVPACGLCINRRLYLISSVQSVTVSRVEKRRAILVDLAIGLGLPVFGMIIYYIPQGRRYKIFEDVGCFSSVYMTPVAWALVLVPPVVVGLVSMVYSILCIRAFWKRHRQFKELLSGNNNLTSSRYIRLICLGSADVFLTLPFGIWSLWLNGRVPMRPWLGWADTHSYFNVIRQYPAVIWKTDRVTNLVLEMTRWGPIGCAVVFFAFFGFADEARKNYKSAIQSVAKRVGYTTFTASGSGSGVFSTSGSISKTFATSKPGGSVGPIYVDTEKITHSGPDELFTPDASYGAMSLKDVSGHLDLEASTRSASPSSPTPQMAELSRDSPASGIQKQSDLSAA